MTENDLPHFITVPEAARRLGLGMNQLRRAIRKGELHPVTTHPGSWPRLNLEDVRQWAENLTPASPDHFENTRTMVREIRTRRST